MCFSLREKKTAMMKFTYIYNLIFCPLEFCLNELSIFPRERLEMETIIMWWKHLKTEINTHSSALQEKEVHLAQQWVQMSFYAETLTHFFQFLLASYIATSNTYQKHSSAERSHHWNTLIHNYYLKSSMVCSCPGCQWHLVLYLSNSGENPTASLSCWEHRAKWTNSVTSPENAFCFHAVCSCSWFSPIESKLKSHTHVINQYKQLLWAS